MTRMLKSLAAAVAGLLCTAGRVWGGIQGQYQFVVSGVVPAATIGGIPTAIFFAGQSTIHLKNGSTVTGIDSGTLDPPPGQGGFRLAHHVRLRCIGSDPPARGLRSGGRHDGGRLPRSLLRGLIIVNRPPIPDPPHRGGCLCGAVRYSFNARPLAVNACHCRDCQRFTGATNFITVYAPRESFVRHYP